MRPEIDWRGFAGDIETALDGRSGRSVCSDENGVNPAMISRARRGEQPLSAASYLAICRRFGLDPWRRFNLTDKRCFRSIKDVLNQRDTADVSHETEGHRHG